MVAIKWGEILPPSYDDPADRAWWTAEAWRRWLIASCEEWNGGHLWVADLDGATVLVDGRKVAGNAWIECAACPAGVYDLDPDGGCCVYGEVAGITINGGLHESLLDLEQIPVSVELRTERYSTRDGVEWDVFIEVSDR